jgi:C-terminal processing protease CtpA/Prc
MKKLLILLILAIIPFNLFAQPPTDTEKLYYTCKIWGYMKYFHSEVSYCEFDWNQVLYDIIPEIIDLESKEDFDYAMNWFWDYAGPMEIATTDPPDDIPTELKRNLNLDWFNDRIISDEVREKLEDIRDNFRPHKPCWTIDNNGSGFGWLAFPYDDPILKYDTYTKFPKESQRLLVFFSFWNMMNYYNPNNYILETPWDSTLYQYIEPIRQADYQEAFAKVIHEIASNLDDAHTEGLTYCNALRRRHVPKILLKNVEDEYVILKSAYDEINEGDIVVSVDGKTTKQWEDSLRKYVSSGNPDVFKRFMNKYLLRGDIYSSISLELKDADNIQYNKTLERNYDYFDDWFYDYMADNDLKETIWKKWECNVGYVNIGKIYSSEVGDMFSELKDTKAIIFDMRYGNISDAAWAIANYIYPNKTVFSILKEPDVNYPGTFFYFYPALGIDNNTDYYKGKVIILCNENTQSSSEYSSMILKAAPDATIIGSQTAGADGNITQFKLTKDIQIGFSSLGVYYPDTTQTQRIGIIPDIEIYPTIEGIRQGRDEVLEKALEVAGCGTSSVDEYKVSEDEICIFPNPAENEINVSGVYGKIKIYNIYGNEEWQGVLEENRRINLEGLSSGVYYIVVEDKFAKSFMVVR